MIILSPSYKRAKLVTSHRLFEKALFRYAVHEFEAKAYRAEGHEVFVLPDKIRGNIARCRNWILEHSGDPETVMVDDDISRLVFIRTETEKRTLNDLSPEDATHLLRVGYQMAADCGAHLWGLNVAHDPRFYTQNRPFSFSLPVLGTFSCHRKPELRYDETLPLKEDYDFFLKSLERHRLVLRFNMLMYIADHHKMAGGCQDYRTDESEADQFDRLQARWGSAIVQRGSSASGHDFNPVLKRPI